MVALAPLPDGPPWVAGVADLRGTPVPVVDLAARLGRVPRTPVLDRRIVVAGDPGEPSARATVGLIVDEVTGVAAGRPGQPATEGSHSALVRRTVRIGEEMVMVLDEAALRTGVGG